MRNLIVSEFVTLDGVMEAPGGEPTHPHTGWVFDCVTYEGFSAAWPQRSGELADKMNEMPKHVASTTLRDPEWSNSSVLELAGTQQFSSGVVVQKYRSRAAS